jgi:putative SOS response-associated peptidase YedK
MCGRFTQAVPWSAVWAFSQPLTIAVPPESFVPSYNVAPTQSAWVIAGDGRGGAKAGRMRWGLVPHWSKDLKSGFSTFNARIETAATKPTFREAFERRHCLVPAGGYYEWTGEGRAKQSWYIHPERDPLLFFAGIWERWTSNHGEPLLSFSILTTAAEGDLASLHHRRPVILPAEIAPAWLMPDHHPASDVLARAAVPALRWYAVAPEVGNAKANGAHLIAPLT